MFKKFSILLITFSIFADKEREARIEQNSIIKLAAFECINVHKCPFFAVSPILQFLIKKMEEDKDFYGFQCFKSKLHKVRNRDNEKEVDRLLGMIEVSIKQMLK